MSLFRRTPSREAIQDDDREAIEVAKAHRLLDRYRAGSPETQTRINWALRMTGDLPADLKGLDDDSDETTEAGELLAIWPLRDSLRGAW